MPSAADFSRAGGKGPVTSIVVHVIFCFPLIGLFEQQAFAPTLGKGADFGSMVMVQILSGLFELRPFLLEASSSGFGELAELVFVGPIIVQKGLGFSKFFLFQSNILSLAFRKVVEIQFARCLGIFQSSGWMTRNE